MKNLTRHQINDLAYQLQIACSAADLHWELSEEADSAGNEGESDKHYSDYYEACETISALLIKLTSGKIDEFTAKRMAHHKRAQIQTLYNKHTV